MLETTTAYTVAICGFFVGTIFGATAQKTNFCTMGAISDIVLMQNWNRFRAWMLAIAISVALSQIFHLTGLINLHSSIYLTKNLGWFGAILGGLLFGFGMTISGGCGNKALVRAGAGNLKSLIVIFTMGFFAYMTLRGIIGVIRVEIEKKTSVDLSILGASTQGIPELITVFTNSAPEAIRTLLTVGVVCAIFIFCFKNSEFRNSADNIASGVIIGTLISIGWLITGVLGYDEFEPTPLTSLTFVNPTADSLQYLMTFTGSTINFGIASVAGVIFGSFIIAKSRGTFQVEGFSDTLDMVRHLTGGAAMGIGGIMALGCTVGQGISGISTLSVGSIIALLSIFAGGYLGIKYLEEGNLNDFLKSFYKKP
ncbi:MAG: hypothetical protein CMF70_09145 [Magnetovibrio sp.]|nr:hypothetical protein [Magnetovibrio sp.]